MYLYHASKWLSTQKCPHREFVCLACVFWSREQSVNWAYLRFRNQSVSQSLDKKLTNVKILWRKNMASSWFKNTVETLQNSPPLWNISAHCAIYFYESIFLEYFSAEKWDVWYVIGNDTSQVPLIALKCDKRESLFSVITELTWGLGCTQSCKFAFARISHNMTRFIVFGDKEMCCLL